MSRVVLCIAGVLLLLLCPAALAQDRPVPPERARYAQLLSEGDDHLQAERFAEALTVFESLVAHADQHESLNRELGLALARVAESSVGVGSAAKAKGLAALDRLVELGPHFKDNEQVIGWRRALKALEDPEPERPPGPSAEEIARAERVATLVETALTLDAPATVDRALELVEQALRLLPDNPDALRAQSALRSTQVRRDERVRTLLDTARSLAEDRATKDAALQQIERVLELVPDHAAALALREAIRARYTGAVYRPGQTQAVRVDNQNIVIEMAWIPPGVFMMGGDQSPEEVARLGGGQADWYRREHPQHRVRISRGFWMMTTEVQQGQFEAVMGYNPSRFKNGPNYPVESVSWFDAVEFANKLTESVARANPQMGLKPHYALSNVQRNDAGRITSADVRSIPGNRGYRLPTEAEWEYACRAGTTTAYAWGDDRNDPSGRFWANGNDLTSKRTNNFGWDHFTWDDGYQHTAPVGTNRSRNIRSNAWGLYDMHGNVWEWCWDWYDAEFYQRGKWPENDAGERVDPVNNTQTSSIRMLRGGSWRDSPGSLRSAFRNWSSPAFRGINLGFRLTLDSE